MAAYVVLSIDVTDPVRYADYARAAGATVEQFGGRYLVRGGRAEALEGAAIPADRDSRISTLARANAWWTSASQN
jgi:uncharacterized protein (DUF1330 family)